MSHTLLILKIFTTFKDVQMILKQFFDTSTGFRFSKMQWGSVPSIPVAVLGLVLSLENTPCSNLLPKRCYVTIFLFITFYEIRNNTKNAKIKVSLQKTGCCNFTVFTTYSSKYWSEYKHRCCTMQAFKVIVGTVVIT